jgi:hypothetical protein
MKKNLARALAVFVALTLAPGAAFADRGGKNEGKHEGKAQQPGRNSPFVGIPVSGTSADGNMFKGTMDIAGFVNDEFGKTKAIGLLTGTITDRFGNSSSVANEVVSVPVVGLNLLGLTVHLDTVRLVINAVPGAGNLLGNLLCAVAGLLDGLAIGPILTNLLNQLTGILAGL